MELLKAQAITPEIVDFINDKIAEGQGIETIIMHEFNQKKVTKRVADKAKSIEKMITDLGYVLKENGYELQQKEEVIIEESKEETQQEEGDIVEDSKEESEQKQDDSKPKKTYLTKKQKEEELRENPFLSVHPFSVLMEVDHIATQISAGNIKNIGVYTNDKVDEAFKLLQDRFYYIPNYLLICAAVKFTSDNLDNFVKSKWVDEFYEVYNHDKRIRKNKNDAESSKKLKEEKKEITSRLEVIKDKKEFKNEEEELKIRLRKINSELRRRQTNVKMSDYVADTSMYWLKKKFPFLSQSDIILMCVYAFSKCMNENEEESRKRLEERNNEGTENNN